MIKIAWKTNTFCLFAVFIVLAAFLAGCERKSEKTTDDKCVLLISKGCTTADTDENGQTSEEEAAAYYGSKLEENRQRLEDHNFAMMRKFDANKNGKLEKREQRTYREFRANLLNQSEAEDSSAEKPSQKYTPRISKGCIRADTDEDGQTSEEEAAAFYRSRLEERREKIARHNLSMMQTYDANKDGKIEKSELDGYHEKRAELLRKKAAEAND